MDEVRRTLLSGSHIYQLLIESFSYTLIFSSTFCSVNLNISHVFRGEYGMWTAFLALLVRLFFYIPGKIFAVLYMCLMYWEFQYFVLFVEILLVFVLERGDIPSFCLLSSQLHAYCVFKTEQSPQKLFHSFPAYLMLCFCWVDNVIRSWVLLVKQKIRVPKVSNPCLWLISLWSYVVWIYQGDSSYIISFRSCFQGNWSCRL